MRIIGFKVFILMTCLSFFGHSGCLFADYVMMCTFWESTIARVYNVSDEGDIQYDYTLDIDSEPVSICFSRNGKWGMVGCWTTSNPATQKTIILDIDENIKISVLGFVHNEYQSLVSISPDSRYGIYGWDLNSVRFYPDNTYYTIPNDNPFIGNREASFSKLNHKLYVQQSSNKKVVECTLLEDGRTTITGEEVDISPSTGAQDLNVSPDGKTCIALSIITYEISVIRIHPEGGASLVQQFNTISMNPYVVDFTPDSKYAVISFYTSSQTPDFIIYRIGEDSLLTEVDSLQLPNDPGEDMAVTPDGKFAITRFLILEHSGPRSYFYVVRIHEDGTLEYLPERDYNCTGFVSDIKFVPPQRTAAGESWIRY